MNNFNRGDLVQTWFDTGAGKMGGAVIIYGEVIAAGPKSARVRWESGLSNRLQQDCRNVTLAADQADARAAMDKATRGEKGPEHG